MKKWNLSVSDLGSWGVDALTKQYNKAHEHAKFPTPPNHMYHYSTKQQLLK
jgi:hypothetical protein